MVSLKKKSVQKSKNPYLYRQIRTSGNTALLASLNTKRRVFSYGQPKSLNFDSLL